MSHVPRMKWHSMHFFIMGALCLTHLRIHVPSHGSMVAETIVFALALLCLPSRNFLIQG